MKYSIVNYETILKDKIRRLEAEFFNSVSFFKDIFYTGKEIIDFIQYGTSKELNENNSGFPTLRLNEFNDLFIKYPAKYCDKIDVETYQHLKLKINDVLICRTNGNPKLVGKSAIVLEDCEYAFASYLFRVRPVKTKILSVCSIKLWTTSSNLGIFCISSITTCVISAGNALTIASNSCGLRENLSSSTVFNKSIHKVVLLVKQFLINVLLPVPRAPNRKKLRLVDNFNNRFNINNTRQYSEIVRQKWSAVHFGVWIL